MKIFDMESLSASEGGEYVLGTKDLHSHACYLIYGTLQAGESERLVRPGEGHEEILCPIDGPIVMHTNQGDIRLEKSHAVHLTENESFFISNPSDRPVVYIMAGGHSQPHH